MKTTQEIHEMKKDCAKAIGEVTDGSEDVYKGWIEALNWVTMTNEQPEPDLPDGLQKYIDGVALNTLYQNYHKSTNGIWCKAEVDECLDDGHGEYYVVNIDFGCQDDTRNEQYRDTIEVYKMEMANGVGWTFNKGEDPADRDDRLYHEGVDDEAVDRAIHNHPLGVGFAQKDKENR